MRTDGGVMVLDTTDATSSSGMSEGTATNPESDQETRERKKGSSSSGSGESDESVNDDESVEGLESQSEGERKSRKVLSGDEMESSEEWEGKMSVKESEGSNEKSGKDLSSSLSSLSSSSSSVGMERIGNGEEDLESKVVENDGLESEVGRGKIYVRVLEYRRPKFKPKKYYVVVHLDKVKLFKTKTTKKQNVWKDPGHIWPVPSDVQRLRIVLHEEGIWSSECGEIELELKKLMDGYPINSWLSVVKGSHVKGELKIQIKYLQQGEEFVEDEFKLPIHSFIENDKFALFEMALEKNPNLVAVDADGRNPLILALELKRFKFACALMKLKKYKMIHASTPKGETALHIAIKSHAPQHVIEMMIKSGFNLKSKTSIRNTPMHYAAMYDNSKAIRTLVEAGVNVDPKNYQGDSPLLLALMNGSLEAIEALIKFKANPYKKNEYGMRVWEAVSRKDLVSEEARDVFLNALDVDDVREFVQRRNLSSKFGIGGCVCSSDYKKSTQIVLSVTEEMKVAILMTAMEKDQIDGFITKSAYIFTWSRNGIYDVPAWSRDMITSGTNRPLSIMLEPGRFYHYIPYFRRNIPNTECKLIVLAPEGKKVSLHKTHPWKYFITKEGCWEGRSAGGAQPNSTWIENPKFSLEMPKENGVHFAVRLSQAIYEEKEGYILSVAKKVAYEYAIGFYILDQSTSNVLGSIDKWTNACDVHQEFVMDFENAHHITILPCCFAPGQESPFTLQVYCQKPISWST